MTVVVVASDCTLQRHVTASVPVLPRQEVERMDKFVAGMTKKSLNGPTPLDSKWKELMDQQEVRP